MGSRWRQIGSVAIVALGLIGWIRFEASDAHATPVNLLTNGSFTTNLTGWTLSRQFYGGCVGYEPQHVTTWPFQGFQALDGNAVWLNACGGLTDRPLISQTLTVTAGVSYDITGHVHTGVNLPGNQANVFHDFDVLVDGISLTLVFEAPNIDGWAPFSTSFTASSSSAVVGFLGERSSDADYVVDSLSVAQTVIPTTTTSTPTPIVAAHSVALDMNGGECIVDGTLSSGELTTVFLGYRYVPGHEECQREGFSFRGWAPRHSTQSADMPMLIDPHDSVWRYFIADDHDLVALWSPLSEPGTMTPAPAAPETVTPSDPTTPAPTPTPAVLPVTGPTSDRAVIWAMVLLGLGMLLTVMSRRSGFLARDLYPYGEKSSPEHQVG